MIKFLLCFLSSVAVAQQPVFNSKGLLIAADGNSHFTALGGNANTEAVSNHDELLAMSFPISLSESKKVPSLPISNSIFNNLSCIEVSTTVPKLAFVLESKGAFTSKNPNSPKTLDKGSFVSVVNISDLKNPKALFRFPIADNPLSMALSPTNEYLAVCSEEYDNELQVIEINFEGKPVRKIKKPIELGNDRISFVQWTNDGDYLAYSNETRKEIGLIQVIRDRPTQKIIRLQLFGKPIKLGIIPGPGKFTKNGKYYLVADMKNAKSSSENLEPAELFVVRFSYDESGQHSLLSKQPVGMNLENFVIHPNNRFVVALNSNKSFYTNPRDDAAGSLTLLNLDENGTISTLGNYRLKGSFPSGLQFDSSGDNLAVSVAESTSYGLSFGGIQFWSLIKTPKPMLRIQPTEFYMQTGVHFLKAVN